MKLVTRFEAAAKSTAELHALHTQALQAFTRAARGSDIRRDALTSLETIEAELAARPFGL
ncbi:hypothetical protein [Epibacterium ulvae]|uniref:hypothetical protein n=1 Tax=Epibacterium ulvae TaxID=1156985 RepID=UPI0024921C1A|nr:hypothetical protein [Epibacterium ulvae]